ASYLPNQVTIATGGTVSATGLVTAFEPDSDKYVITASTGAAAKLTTAIDVNGLLDVVVRNAPGAVTLTVATTQNLGDGITNLGGIAVDGPGTATITAANTSINPGISFTGNTINGSPTVTNVSNVAGLAIGMPIFGPGIPVGATIVAIDPTNFGTATITLSANASATVAATLTAADPYADILVQGQLAALTLRDFNGSFAPNFQDFIRAGGLNSQNTTITGRRFDSVSIALPTVLTSLTLADYNNSVGIDTVTAERFGTIKTTGVPLTFVRGDFIVSRLTNLNTLGSTMAGLGTATIANKVTGQFDIQKTVTSVTSKIAQNFSLGLPGGANN